MNPPSSPPEAERARQEIPPPHDYSCYEEPGAEAADLRQELSDAFKRAMESFVPLWHALVGLVIAQAKLSKILVQEGIKVIAVRGILLIHLWLFAGLAWLFLNIGVWRVAMEYYPDGVVAPFAVLGMHLIAIAAMAIYFKRVKL